MIFLKKEEEIKILKEGGKILSLIMKNLKKEVKSGVSLNELDKKAYELIKHYKAEPAFLNYQPSFAKKPFPNSLCVSLNEVIVHGVPYKNVFLKKGDVVSLDLGIKYKGFYTDMAITVGLGVKKEYKKMILVGRKALKFAISLLKEGKRLGDIGWIIEKTIKKYGFQPIKDLAGHGVGYYLHEDPLVYNFGRENEGLELKKGMILAIEPMLTNGCGLIVENEDGSFRTIDKKVAVHFEATVAVGKNKGIIITPLI
jgi:methionyl aminopeptidase